MSNISFSSVEVEVGVAVSDNDDDDDGDDVVSLPLLLVIFRLNEVGVDIVGFEDCVDSPCSSVGIVTNGLT